MKQRYRQQLADLRSSLSAIRRQEAAHSLYTYGISFLSSLQTVLSFMSFGEEIDLVPLNTFLAATGRLLLPRIAEDRFRLFQVGNLERELLPHPYGILEPNPEMCSEVEIDSVSFVLVPALGFDRQCNRLGYGGGYYDRFLRAKPTIYSVGVGFREQLVEALPISKLDVPVQELYLC